MTAKPYNAFIVKVRFRLAQGVSEVQAAEIIAAELRARWGEDDAKITSIHSDPPLASEPEVYTNPTAAARIALGHADVEAATSFLYNRCGWQCLIAIAKEHGIKANKDTAMSRGWCERLAREIRAGSGK
jgi:hypothetical protein